MKQFSPLLCIFALTLSLVACQVENEATTIPEPVEEAATTVPEPTKQPTAIPEPTKEPETESTTEVVAEEEPVEPTKRPVVEPPSTEEAGVLPIDQFYIDAVGLAAAWGHKLEQGTTLDLNHPPANNGIPPHIIVSFGGPDEKVTYPQVFSPQFPQGRILPIQAYLNMYEIAGSDSVVTRVETLQRILEKRPQNIEGSIPILPITGATEILRGNTNFIDFDGGSGVGYVSYLAPGVAAIFNNQLIYLFQGLTDDGQHWVSFVWPLTVNFLPSSEQATQEDHLEADQDPGAYLEEVNKLVDEAADSDFDPVLVALNQMMQSMVIGEAAQVDKPPSPNIFSLKWEWEQFQDQAELNDITVSNPENYQLILWTDGTYNFKADCNAGGGVYTMNGASFSLEPGPVTLAECGLDSLYDQYLNQLANVATYVTNEGKLILNLFADAGNMVFTSAGPVPYAELVEFGRAGNEQ